MSKREDFKNKVMSLIEIELSDEENKLEAFEYIAFALGDAAAEVEKEASKLVNEKLRGIH